MADQPARAARRPSYLPGQPAVLSDYADGHSGVLLGAAGDHGYPRAELRVTPEGNALRRPIVVTVARSMIRGPVIHVTGSTAAAYRLADREQMRVRGGDVLWVPSEGVAGIHCPPILKRPVSVTARDGTPGSFHPLEPPDEKYAGSWLYTRSIAMARALVPAPGASADAQVFAGWAAGGFSFSRAAGTLGVSESEAFIAVERYIRGTVAQPGPDPGKGIRHYGQRIGQAIGYGDPATVELIEDLMRAEARGALDHLDGEQFDGLARECAQELVFMHAEGRLRQYCGKLMKVPPWAGRPAWPWHNPEASDPGWRRPRGGGSPAGRQRGAGAAARQQPRAGRPNSR